MQDSPPGDEKFITMRDPFPNQDYPKNPPKFYPFFEVLIYKSKCVEPSRFS
jgi:hypothetical protein